MARGGAGRAFAVGVAQRTGGAEGDHVRIDAAGSTNRLGEETRDALLALKLFKWLVGSHLSLPH